jgi:hypothetical protein
MAQVRNTYRGEVQVCNCCRNRWVILWEISKFRVGPTWAMCIIRFSQLARFVLIIDSNFWTGYGVVSIIIANGCDFTPEWSLHWRRQCRDELFVAEMVPVVKYLAEVGLAELLCFLSQAPPPITAARTTISLSTAMAKIYFCFECFGWCCRSPAGSSPVPSAVCFSCSGTTCFSSPKPGTACFRGWPLMFLQSCRI